MLQGVAEESEVHEKEGRGRQDGKTKEIAFETTEVMLRTQQRREMSRVPTSLIDGAMRSITGLYLDPLVGIKKNGALGLATGILKATIALPLRPTYGLLRQVQEMLDAWSRPYLRNDAFRDLNVSSFLSPHTPVLFHEECHVGSDLQELYSLYATSEEIILCHFEDLTHLSSSSSSSSSHHQISHQLSYSQILTVELLDEPVIHSTEISDRPFIEIEIHNSLVCVPLGDQQLTADEGRRFVPSSVLPSLSSSSSAAVKRKRIPKYGLRLEYRGHNKSDTRLTQESLVLWFCDVTARSEFQSILSSLSPQTKLFLV
jgi:hypothetical protein